MVRGEEFVKFISHKSSDGPTIIKRFIEFAGKARIWLSDAPATPLQSLWCNYDEFCSLRNNAKKLSWREQQNAERIVADKYASIFIKVIKCIVQKLSNESETTSKKDNRVVALLVCATLSFDVLICIREFLNCKPFSIENIQYQLIKCCIGVKEFRLAIRNLACIRQYIWEKHEEISQDKKLKVADQPRIIEDITSVGYEHLHVLCDYPNPNGMYHPAFIKIVLNCGFLAACIFFEQKHYEGVLSAVSSADVWIYFLKSNESEITYARIFADRLFRLMWKAAALIDSSLNVAECGTVDSSIVDLYVSLRSRALQYCALGSNPDPFYIVQQAFRVGVQMEKKYSGKVDHLEKKMNIFYKNIFRIFSNLEILVNQKDIFPWDLVLFLDHCICSLQRVENECLNALRVCSTMIEILKDVHSEFKSLSSIWIIITLVRRVEIIFTCHRLERMKKQLDMTFTTGKVESVFSPKEHNGFSELKQCTKFATDISIEISNLMRESEAEQRNWKSKQYLMAWDRKSVRCLLTSFKRLTQLHSLGLNALKEEKYGMPYILEVLPYVDESLVSFSKLFHSLDLVSPCESINSLLRDFQLSSNSVRGFQLSLQTTFSEFQKCVVEMKKSKYAENTMQKTVHSFLRTCDSLLHNLNFEPDSESESREIVKLLINVVKLTGNVGSVLKKNRLYSVSILILEKACHIFHTTREFQDVLSNLSNCEVKVEDLYCLLSSSLVEIGCYNNAVVASILSFYYQKEMKNMEASLKRIYTAIVAKSRYAVENKLDIDWSNHCWLNATLSSPRKWFEYASDICEFWMQKDKEVNINMLSMKILKLVESWVSQLVEAQRSKSNRKSNQEALTMILEFWKTILASWKDCIHKQVDEEFAVIRWDIWNSKYLRLKGLVGLQHEGNISEYLLSNSNARELLRVYLKEGEEGSMFSIIRMWFGLLTLEGCVAYAYYRRLRQKHKVNILSLDGSEGKKWIQKGVSGLYSFIEESIEQTWDESLTIVSILPSIIRVLKVLSEIKLEILCQEVYVKTVDFLEGKLIKDTTINNYVALAIASYKAQNKKEGDGVYNVVENMISDTSNPIISWDMLQAWYAVEHTISTGEELLVRSSLNLWCKYKSRFDSFDAVHQQSCLELLCSRAHFCLGNYFISEYLAKQSFSKIRCIISKYGITTRQSDFIDTEEFYLSFSNPMKNSSQPVSDGSYKKPTKISSIVEVNGWEFLQHALDCLRTLGIYSNTLGKPHRGWMYFMEGYRLVHHFGLSSLKEPFLRLLIEISMNSNQWDKANNLLLKLQQEKDNTIFDERKLHDISKFSNLQVNQMNHSKSLERILQDILEAEILSNRGLVMTALDQYCNSYHDLVMVSGLLNLDDWTKEDLLNVYQFRGIIMCDIEDYEANANDIKEYEQKMPQLDFIVSLFNEYCSASFCSALAITWSKIAFIIIKKLNIQEQDVMDDKLEVARKLLIASKSLNCLPSDHADILVLIGKFWKTRYEVNDQNLDTLHNAVNSFEEAFRIASKIKSFKLLKIVARELFGVYFRVRKWDHASHLLHTSIAISVRLSVLGQIEKDKGVPKESTDQIDESNLRLLMEQLDIGINSKASELNQRLNIFAFKEDISRSIEEEKMRISAELPSEWVVVGMVLDESCENLIISRIEKNSPPVVVRVDFSKNNQNLWVEASEKFDSVMNDSQKSLSAENTRNSKNWSNQMKKNWWRTRDKLDLELLESLQGLQDCMGVWKCLLLGKNTASELCGKDKISTVMNLLSQYGIENKDPSLESMQLLRLLLENAKYLSDEELRDGFLYIFQMDTEPNSYDDICIEFIEQFREIATKTFREKKNVKKNIGSELTIREVKKMKVKELKEELKKYGAPISGLKADLIQRLSNLISQENDGKYVEENDSLEESINKEIKRGPTILILDDQLHKYPWEGFPYFQNQAFSRIPCISLLFDQLIRLSEQKKSKEKRKENWNILEQGIRMNKVSFILDPEDNLASTRAALGDFLQQYRVEYNWSGIIGRKPMTSEIRDLLVKNDVLIYCGHGSGEKFIPREDVEKLPKCCVAFLIGCSSGKLIQQGLYDPSGMVWSYLLAGSPNVVGMLWDVTDRDIDRFSQVLLSEFFPLKNDDSGDPKYISECFKIARKACRLPSLTGLAAVSYGLPLTPQGLIKLKS